MTPQDSGKDKHFHTFSLIYGRVKVGRRSTPDVIKADTRGEKAELRPLQVRIPASVFDEFSQRAGQEFGFTHGAKKQLFLRMWEDYKKHNA